ncbi:MAG: ATP synthase subunit I [Eubacterium sp.]|nr:ATP synthase subunit I [Eubacterium sp.]
MESFETDMEKGSTETVINSSDTATEDEKIVHFPDRQIAKKTLKRVIIGIWIFAAAVLAVGIWFVENKLAFAAGDLIGSGIATALMYHLYHCIDVELDIGEVKARAHARWNTMLRFTIEIAAVVGCCFISDYINPVALLIGLFGRKIGAIMVPLFFDKERNGQMTEEDRKQLRTYGRLLSNKEMREMEESDQEAVEGSETSFTHTPE